MKYFRIIVGSFLLLNVVVFLTGATDGELRVVSLSFALACALGAYYVWPRDVWPRRLVSR